MSLIGPGINILVQLMAFVGGGLGGAAWLKEVGIIFKRLELPFSAYGKG